MYRLVRARFENILEIEKDDFFGKCRVKDKPSNSE